MKTMSEMRSKAGISTKGKLNMLCSVFSKSASLLLIIMFGFSTMSFVQDEAFVSSGDTNQSVTKVKHSAPATSNTNNEVCCVVASSNPGKGIINANYISMPGKTAMYNADKETIVGFISDVKERRIWSLNRAKASKEADKTMHNNFMLSSIYPSDRMVVKADEEMSRNFAANTLQWSAFNTEAAIKADEEVAAQFLADHLFGKLAFPSVEEMEKADAGMRKLFEINNTPVISLPSADIIQKADQEVLNINNLRTK